MPFYRLFLGGGFPSKIDYRKKATLFLTFLPEDLGSEVALVTDFLGNSSLSIRRAVLAESFRRSRCVCLLLWVPALGRQKRAPTGNQPFVLVCCCFFGFVYFLFGGRVLPYNLRQAHLSCLGCLYFAFFHWGYLTCQV